MRTHICVPIEKALDLLEQGENVLDCTPVQAYEELTAARAEGKTYYSGCENMNEEGRCAGHPDLPTKSNES